MNILSSLKRVFLRIFYHLIIIDACNTREKKTRKKETIDPRPEKSAQRDFCHSVCGQSVEHYSTALLLPFPFHPCPTIPIISIRATFLWHIFRIRLLLLEVNFYSLFSGLLRCNPSLDRGQKMCSPVSDN